MVQTLEEIGEFGFIEKIRRAVHTDASVALGIGDDAAVIKVKSQEQILFTTDMLIEDRHFRLSQVTPWEIGWKAMCVNISDIAAMGGVPTHAVIAVGLPGSLGLDFAEGLYRGLASAARSFKINIVGGDTNCSDKLVISVAMLGKVNRGAYVTRSGAKPGDIVFVTGSLGGSYESRNHLNFTPRIKESQYLVKNFKVHSMIDISDGLSSDIRRLAKESAVGALLREPLIPLSKSAKNAARALTDGEDFELLFTMPSQEAEWFKKRRKPKALVKFHEIGKIVSRKMGIKIMDRHGRLRILEEKGFDHYRK